MIDMALQIVKVIVSQSETESVTSQLDQMRPLTTGDDLYFPLLDQKKKKNFIIFIIATRATPVAFLI